MATSPATIVIGLVTAAAFGMAARDTAQHKRFLTPAEQVAEERAAREQEQLKYEQEAEARAAADAAKEEAIEVARKAKLDAILPTLFGATVGPGPAGDAEVTLETLGLHTYSSGDERSIMVLSSDRWHSELCASIRGIVEKWPDSQEVGRRSVWFDPTTHQRVSLEVTDSYDDASCTVSFDKAATTAEWVDAVAPGTLVGKSTAALEKWVAARQATELDTSYESSWTWRDSGLEYGAGGTDLTANIENGKVTSVRAVVQASTLSQENVMAALTKRFGAPKQDTYEGTSWPKPVYRHVTLDGEHLEYDLGE